MKKILLIAINARWTHSNPAVHYLKTRLKKFNHPAEVLELNINTELIEILSSIYKKKPDILAFSVYIWNSNIVKSILPEIKKILPTSKVVLGGPEVSYNPNYWLSNFPSIDHIIVGQGESSIIDLVEGKLSSKIIFKKNLPFSEIDFPYSDDDFDKLQNKYIYYETSRGCPFQCSYCLSSREDQRLEFRSINKVKKEIDFIAEHHPKIIKLVDRTFNANKMHARAIWRYLIEKNYDIRFHFEIHPLLLDDADFEILSYVKKGYFQFEIGVQSLNEKTLKAINRKTDWAVAKQNIKRLLEINNIHIHLDLIIGLPYEDLSSFEKSFDNVYSLKPHQLQIGFLKVLPGTPIEIDKEKYGIINLTSAPYTVLSTEFMDFDTISMLHQFERAFNLFYNSHYLDITIKHLEEYFDTSFDMFYKLSIELGDKKIASYKKIFEFLYHFIIKENNSLFLIDCLRWDWAKLSKAHYYPPYLNNENLLNAKLKGYKFLLQEGKISKTDLKRAVFFSANSKKFKKLYQQGKKITVFINTKKKIINLPFEGKL